MDASASTSLMMAQASPLAAAPKATGDAAKADAASKEYESVFISQFLGSMFSGIKSDGITGGGQGEEMFRSMMTDKYAEGLVKQGGFGLASSIKAQMLKMQEAHS